MQQCFVRPVQVRYSQREFCTVCVVIQGQCNHVQLHVLPKCVYNLIPGLNVLESHKAVIDQANSKLCTHFEVFPVVSYPLVVHKLFIPDVSLLPPHTTTLINASTATVMTKYLMLRPKFEHFLRKILFVPYCVAFLCTYT